MIRLYVNVDHVATLRQARQTYEPDPMEAALVAEKAGVHGITVHLREDRRHIQDHDLERIKQTIKGPLNLEMAAVDEMIGIAQNLRPYQVSLVPEKRQEITTEGGLNVVAQEKHLDDVRMKMVDAGILFSLFVDPDFKQIDAAYRAGARSIEINTGPYSECENEQDMKSELKKIVDGARHARDQGLRVFAGHGLKVDNVEPIAAIPEIEELNIGHHLVSRSIFIGMEQAVRNMQAAIGRGVAQRDPASIRAY
ncbi:MAG: pyridoxine 5'-phosphate synthase [Candidatus Nitronauta litoralis]|uniref:Pyridoxine 5'-phosphate synthase n=1 Tax=Candidatus Nitronauta litoralis TaxID=2705533 RepID=A0A7T0BYS8_9BACT|nr:MAG: pyridoxine 5'-phosphate synthase [Candidatus Nitronauta litoralis]